MNISHPLKELTLAHIHLVGSHVPDEFKTKIMSALGSLLEDATPLPIELILMIRENITSTQAALDKLKEELAQIPAIHNIGAGIVLPSSSDIMTLIEGLNLKTKKRLFYYAVKKSIWTSWDMYYGISEDGTISCIKLDEEEEGFVNDTNRVWIENFTPTGRTLENIWNQIFGIFGKTIISSEGTEITAFATLPNSGRTEDSTLLIDSPYDNNKAWWWFLTNTKTGFPAVMRGEIGSTPDSEETGYTTQKGSNSQKFRRGNAVPSYWLLFEQDWESTLHVEDVF